MEEFLSFIADILEVDKNTLTLETSRMMWRHGIPSCSFVCSVRSRQNTVL